MALQSLEVGCLEIVESPKPNHSMLFDFLYSLLNPLMATTLSSQQKPKELQMNGTAGGGGEFGSDKCNGISSATVTIKQQATQQNGHLPKGDVTNGVNAEKTAGINGKEEEEETKVEVQQNKCLTVKDWDYEEHGPCGPRHWLKIAGCTHLGDNQSPIDLQLSKIRVDSLDSQPLCLVNYRKPLIGQLVNNGCSIQFLPDPQLEPPEIYGGKLDQNYRLIQYHFHWAQNDNEGSEHTIGGLRYPAELHLVHQGVQDPCKLAVLGIFLKLDDGQPQNGHEKKFVFDTQEMEALRKLTDFEQKVSLDAKHCLASKLPANCCHEAANKGAEHFHSSFVRYQGSLTTPPCTENVVWTVFTDPLLISKEQLSLLRAVKDCRGQVIAKNYRPVQKVGNRQVHLLLAAAQQQKNGTQK